MPETPSASISEIGITLQAGVAATDRNFLSNEDASALAHRRLVSEKKDILKIKPDAETSASLDPNKLKLKLERYAQDEQTKLLKKKQEILSNFKDLETTAVELVGPDIRPSGAFVMANDILQDVEDLSGEQLELGRQLIREIVSRPDDLGAGKWSDVFEVDNDSDELYSWLSAGANTETEENIRELGNKVLKIAKDMPLGSKRSWGVIKKFVGKGGVESMTDVTALLAKADKSLGGRAADYVKENGSRKLEVFVVTFKMQARDYFEYTNEKAAVEQLETHIPDIIESYKKEIEVDGRDAKPGAAETDPLEDEAPDWLSSLSGGDHDSQEVAREPSDGLPNWLRESRYHRDNEATLIGDIPDWLSGLDSSTADKSEDSNVPDWLREHTYDEKKAESKPDSLGDDWLNFLRAAEEVPTESVVEMPKVDETAELPLAAEPPDLKDTFSAGNIEAELIVQKVEAAQEVLVGIPGEARLMARQAEVASRMATRALDAMKNVAVNGAERDEFVAKIAASAMPKELSSIFNELSVEKIDEYIKSNGESGASADDILNMIGDLRGLVSDVDGKPKFYTVASGKVGTQSSTVGLVIGKSQDSTTGEYWEIRAASKAEAADSEIIVNKVAPALRMNAQQVERLAMDVSYFEQQIKESESRLTQDSDNLKRAQGAETKQVHQDRIEATKAEVEALKALTKSKRLSLAKELAQVTENKTFNSILDHLQAEHMAVADWMDGVEFANTVDVIAREAGISPADMTAEVLATIAVSASSSAESANNIVDWLQNSDKMQDRIISSDYVKTQVAEIAELSEEISMLEQRETKTDKAANRQKAQLTILKRDLKKQSSKLSKHVSSKLQSAIPMELRGSDGVSNTSALEHREFDKRVAALMKENGFTREQVGNASGRETPRSIDVRQMLNYEGEVTRLAAKTVDAMSFLHDVGPVADLRSALEGGNMSEIQAIVSQKVEAELGEMKRSEALKNQAELSNSDVWIERTRLSQAAEKDNVAYLLDGKMNDTSELIGQLGSELVDAEFRTKLLKEIEAQLGDLAMMDTHEIATHGNVDGLIAVAQFAKKFASQDVPVQKRYERIIGNFERALAVSSDEDEKKNLKTV
ncbi:MAG: hypothetical protein WAV40_02835 [Microgenomates group bacterium]